MPIEREHRAGEEMPLGPYTAFVGAVGVAFGAVLWRGWRSGTRPSRVSSVLDSALLVGIGFAAGWLAPRRPRREAKIEPGVRFEEDVGELATDGGGVCEGWVPHDEVHPDDVGPDEIG